MYVSFYLFNSFKDLTQFIKLLVNVEKGGVGCAIDVNIK